MIWQRNADPYGSQKNDKGFTLIELLVVIFIISLLSLLVLTWLNSGRGKGRLAAAQQTMRHVRLQAAVCLSAGEAVNIPGSSGPVSDNNNGSDLTICSGGVQRYPALPVALAGFSFGTFVQAQLQQRLRAQGKPAQRLVLVGCAAGKWAMPEVPADTILIHGELDDTIPLTHVFDWARPQDLPVIVIPGADHFFHRKLQHIKNFVVEMWRR